jgi:hypothetical protein
MRGRQVLHALAIAFMLVSTTNSRAVAEVRISGNSQHLVMQAQNASLPEILSSLMTALHFEVELKGSTNLQFNGTYTGSARRILERLLLGVDYVANASAGHLQLILVQGNGPKPAPVVSATAADAFGDPNDPALAALATAAATGHEGSRASRIRQQRMVLRPSAGPDY